MLKIFKQSLIFIISLAVVTEICLRFAHFGTAAFNPQAMNSYTLIMNSDLVKPADNVDIYYELKPDLNALFRGKRITTNSQGLADKEYSLEKPANVFRIAVVGSSWTMATGVESENNYHTLLEERFRGRPGNKIEIINFAVEFYGFGEIISTIENKVLAYNPDMIILATTAITPGILWEQHKEPFTASDTTSPFLQSYLLSSVLGQLGKSAYKIRRRPVVDPVRGAYIRQIERCLKEFQTLISNKNINGMVIWLTYDLADETIIKTTAKHAETNDLKFLSINLKTEARKKNISDGLIVSQDTHPNETGHRLIAERLYDEILIQQ
jgi:hypothetical protein